MSTWRSRNAIIDFVDSGIMNQTCHWLLPHVNMVKLKYLLYKMIQNFTHLFKILISSNYSHQIILIIISNVKWLKKIHLKHQKCNSELSIASLIPNSCYLWFTKSRHTFFALNVPTFFVVELWTRCRYFAIKAFSL